MQVVPFTKRHFSEVISVYSYTFGTIGTVVTYGTIGAGGVNKGSGINTGVERLTNSRKALESIAKGNVDFKFNIPDVKVSDTYGDLSAQVDKLAVDSANRRLAEQKAAYTNRNSMMRYAPVIGNMAQYAGMIGKRPKVEKAHTVKTPMLNNKLNYTPRDLGLLPKIKQQGDAAMRLAQSGALGNSAMRGLLSSRIAGETQGNLTNARIQEDMYNQGNMERIAAHNLGIDRYNQEASSRDQMFNAQAQREVDIANMQNMAALDNQRSAAMAGIFGQLGQIGKENWSMNAARSMSLGYGPDQHGNFNYHP